MADRSSMGLCSTGRPVLTLPRTVRPRYAQTPRSGTTAAGVGKVLGCSPATNPHLTPGKALTPEDARA